LKILPTLPDHSVDMVLADLPFGTTKNQWDSVIPMDHLWEQYKRLLKVGGVVALFGDEPFASRLRMSNSKWYRYDWIWIKNRATGFLNANRMPLKNTETISIFYPKLPLYNPQMRTGFKAYHGKTGRKTSNYGSFTSIETINQGERYPLKTLNYSVVPHTIHPTQKPVKLLEYLIKTYTNEGMTVLDNTMGSGSTGVACKNLNRNFIGIEKDPDYFKLAKERLDGNVD
jgi:DNA modification methylase